MYFVKTRNWAGARWIQQLLDISIRFGVNGYPEDGGDGKYYIETFSPVRAWLIWAYFMLLSPFSGGWTYILRPGREVDGRYLSVY